MAAGSSARTVAAVFFLLVASLSLLRVRANAMHSPHLRVRQHKWNGRVAPVCSFILWWTVRVRTCAVERGWLTMGMGCWSGVARPNKMGGGFLVSYANGVAAFVLAP